MSKLKAVDELNLDIIRHLWNGRKPYAEIANELGITTNTVRNRVNKLKKDGVLQIIGLVDPSAVPGHYSAFMAFKVETHKLAQALEQIGNMKGVVMAGCVNGRYDIMALAFFNEEYTHEKFVFEELSKVDGVIGVETFYVVRGVHWQLRYVL